jgi:hypothetical protein
MNLAAKIIYKLAKPVAAKRGLELKMSTDGQRIEFGGNADDLLLLAMDFEKQYPALDPGTMLEALDGTTA